MEVVESVIGLKGVSVVLIGALTICFIGYALGRIRIKGVSLGTAGVFLTAFLFGFLFTVPGLETIAVLRSFYVPDSSSSVVSNYKFLETTGLVLFVTAVGCIAGPNFFRDLKKNAKSYVPLGAVIILTSAVLTILLALIPGMGSDFSNGILSGAMTSTPAFSASKQVAENEGLVALGHAVAYPFGVIITVLFVQIVPRILKVDMEEERRKISVSASAQGTESAGSVKKGILLDTYGIASFGLVVVLGILLGAIRIPLTGEGFNGACFSLGNTGGPLIVALIVGHFGHIGKLSMRVSGATLKLFREFGLMLFLVGAGVEGGVELVSQINASDYGAMLIVYGLLAGIVITILPLLVGYFFAKRVFKLDVLNNFGALTGGMTSTPALGALISVAQTDDVTSAYASTYPVALVLIVLASNLIGTFIP